MLLGTKPGIIKYANHIRCNYDNFRDNKSVSNEPLKCQYHLPYRVKSHETSDMNN